MINIIISLTATIYNMIILKLTTIDSNGGFIYEANRLTRILYTIFDMGCFIEISITTTAYLIYISTIYYNIGIHYITSKATTTNDAIISSTIYNNFSLCNVCSSNNSIICSDYII